LSSQLFQGLTLDTFLSIPEHELVLIETITGSTATSASALNVSISGYYNVTSGNQDHSRLLQSISFVVFVSLNLIYATVNTSDYYIVTNDASNMKTQLQELIFSGSWNTKWTQDLTSLSSANETMALVTSSSVVFSEPVYALQILDLTLEPTISPSSSNLPTSSNEYFNKMGCGTNSQCGAGSYVVSQSEGCCKLCQIDSYSVDTNSLSCLNSSYPTRNSQSDSSDCPYSSLNQSQSVSLYIAIGLVLFVFILVVSRCDSSSRNQFIATVLPTTDVILNLFLLTLAYYNQSLLYTSIVFLILLMVYFGYYLCEIKEKPIVSRLSQRQLFFQSTIPASYLRRVFVFGLFCVLGMMQCCHVVALAVAVVLNILFHLFWFMISCICFCSGLWSIQDVWRPWVFIWTGEETLARRIK